MNARTIPVLSFLMVALGGSACVSCVEDGFVPDCPREEDYLTEDGELDFDAWREAAVEDGCLTPVGGAGEGGSGGAGS